MKYYYQKGVNLVELSIVLTIMGVLLAGTLGGMSILKASKLRKMATEFTTYAQAIEQFESDYYYLPGDMANASDYWSGANDGDGDTIVDWDGAAATAQEDLFAWEHLGLANLIGGNFTGAVISGTVRYGLDTNQPKSEAYNDMGFIFYNLTATVYSRLGTAIEAASLITASGLPNGGGLMAKDAYSIDVKIDDGLASSGRLFSYRETADSGCASAAFTAASATYDLDATDKTCQLLYFYREAPRN